MKSGTPNRNRLDGTPKKQLRTFPLPLARYQRQYNLARMRVSISDRPAAELDHPINLIISHKLVQEVGFEPSRAVVPPGSGVAFCHITLFSLVKGCCKLTLSPNQTSQKWTNYARSFEPTSYLSP